MDTSLIADNKKVISSFYFLIFFVVLISGILSASKFMFAASSKEDVIDMKSSGVIDEGIYLRSNNVMIFAEVPYFVGIKNLSSHGTENSYMVFGNFEKGFIMVDYKSKQIVYNYNSIPGDGVMFNIEGHKEIIFIPKF